MSSINNLFLYFIIYSLIWNSNTLKCGEAEIENCIQCGIGDKNNTCIKCSDKYFLFYNNLYCISCSDPLYGQIGCEGSCKKANITNSFNNGNIICDINGCKEGFYNLNGTCLNCFEDWHDCKTCTIIQEEYDNLRYNCTECLSNEYILNSYGGCTKCNIYNCNKCHYNEFSIEICDKCKKGFYLDNTRQYCKKCQNINITNRFCEICSESLDDYGASLCSCNTYYTLKGYSTCVRCPNNCPYCINNNQTKKIECISCDEGYTINSEKTCTYCGEGCRYCFLADDSTPNCLLCHSNKVLDNYKCFNCP